MTIFPPFFLRQLRPEKCVLEYPRTKKTPLWAIKTTTSKSQKIEIFQIPKGLTHGFGQKLAIFSSFFFRQYRPRKCVLGYFTTKKKPF